MQLWHSEWTRPKWKSHGWPFAGQVAPSPLTRALLSHHVLLSHGLQGGFSFVSLHFIDFPSFPFFLSRGKDGEDILSAAPHIL